MNERIAKLAEQCTTQYRDGNGGYIDQLDTEKFAELILEECAKVCDDYALHSSNPMNFAENCAETIRKMK